MAAVIDTVNSGGLLFLNISDTDALPEDEDDDVEYNYIADEQQQKFEEEFRKDKAVKVSGMTCCLLSCFCFFLQIQCPYVTYL